VTRSRPYLLPLIDSALDAVLYAVIDSVLFRERLAFTNRVLGAGVEPAHLAAPEPKSGVSAITPPASRLTSPGRKGPMNRKEIEGRLRA
jgi:hypothetical protein